MILAISVFGLFLWRQFRTIMQFWKVSKFLDFFLIDLFRFLIFILLLFLFFLFLNIGSILLLLNDWIFVVFSNILNEVHYVISFKIIYKYYMQNNVVNIRIIDLHWSSFISIFIWPWINITWLDIGWINADWCCIKSCYCCINSC